MPTLREGKQAKEVHVLVCICSIVLQLPEIHAQSSTVSFSACNARPGIIYNRRPVSFGRVVVGGGGGGAQNVCVLQYSKRPFVLTLIHVLLALAGPR